MELADLLRVRGCRLRRKSDGSLALNAGLLEGGGGFAFDLRPWLRRAIVGGAIEALRGKLQKELVALEKNGGKADEPDDDTAGLERVLSKAPATWLPKTVEPWLPEQLMRQVRVGVQ